MLRVLVSGRGAMVHRKTASFASGAMPNVFSKHTSQKLTTRNLWMGTSTSSHPTHHSAHKIAIPQQLQRRNYIFLPASLSEASSKFLKTIFENNQQSHKRLMVKVQTRWQDTLFTFQTRMKLLKQIQREQRKFARQRAKIARTSMMKRSAKYSLFVKNMHRKVGCLSSIGRQNLVSHYNAKKRIYARRRGAIQLARKMNGNNNNSSSRTFIERWKSKYTLARNGEWGSWIGSKQFGITPTTLSTTTWKGITLTEPTQQSWFDEEGYPLTSRDPETGRFVNPWLSESTNGENGLYKFLRWKVGGPWCRLLEAVGVSGDHEMCKQDDAKLEFKSSDANNGMINQDLALSGSPKASTYKSSSPYAIQTQSALGGKSFHTATSERNQAVAEVQEEQSINLTWIGHSSAMVTFPGEFTILTDPHFSNYAGPVRRNAPPAFGVADLPDLVDCVLISHDHMDHLDYWSILELIDSNKVKYWIVPLGIKSWLMDQAGVSPDDIIELEWWEGVRISKEPKGSNSEMILPDVEGLVRTVDRRQYEGETAYGTPGKNELVVTCAPAQHWCSRSPFDRNRRLWCSFAVHATPAQSQSAPKTHSFYFAGDTGLPPEFPLHQQIGDRLGPFDLSAIPIGAYEPEWFMRESHCNPSEAVKIHQAVRSRRSIAIHFDTFDLADEAREDPPRRLLEEVGRLNGEIMQMADEVASVADEMRIAAKAKETDGRLDIDEALKVEPSSDKAVVVSEVSEQLIEMLPPLIDFAVIKPGQTVDSLQ